MGWRMEKMTRQIHKIWTVPKLAHQMTGVKPANAPDGGGLKLFRPANQMVDHARRLFTYYRFLRARSPLNVAKANKINANFP